jgi:hypothetical protein
MDKFYIIVLTVATVLLILILTYVGITLNTKKTTTQLFPPTSATCPDYWKVSPTDSSLCVVPAVGYKNTGDIYDNIGSVTLKGSSTFGYDSTNKTINFADKKWDSTGLTTMCAKKKWASNHGIVWDGVSNNNSC